MDIGERRGAGSQFPHQHGWHLRTTNVIASHFAAGRLRTTAGKLDTPGTRHRAELDGAAQPFRRLHAPKSLPAISAGRPNRDGDRTQRVAHQGPPPDSSYLTRS